MNHQINTSTVSPAWAWPTLGWCKRSLTASVARTYRHMFFGLTAMWLVAFLGRGPLLPAICWWALPEAGTSTHHTTILNSHSIPQSPSLRTASTLFHTLWTLCLSARRKKTRTLCTSRLRMIEWDWNMIAQTARGPHTSKKGLVRVMTNAVQELELSQSPLEEPAKSKLNFWYFRLTCCQADSRVSVPFFPDVHE